MNKTWMIAIVLCFVYTITYAQSKDNSVFLKTKNGLEYKTVKSLPGAQKAKNGDVVQANVELYLNDSLLNTFKEASIKIFPATKHGESVEGFTLFGIGEDGIFRVAVDTLKKYTDEPLPSYMASGKYLYYHVHIISVKTQNEIKQEAKNTITKEKASDEKTLGDYFSSHNIKATKAPSGIYYTTETEGSGDKIQPGKTVSIKYIGKTLDGKVFDANTGPDAKHTNEFSFMVGRGDVIPGMEEGVMQMKKGGKSTIYIPSELGYGADGAGEVIPPYAVLIFEVEVTNVK